jgi:hypothetical protein
LIFIDESSINTKLGQSKYGYGKKSSKISYKVTSQKAENLSLLSALSVEEYIACSIYKRGVNAEMYEEFIRDEVLLKCNL